MPQKADTLSLKLDHTLLLHWESTPHTVVYQLGDKYTNKWKQIGPELHLILTLALMVISVVVIWQNKISNVRVFLVFSVLVLNRGITALASHQSKEGTLNMDVHSHA